MAPQSAMPADPAMPAKRDAVCAWCRLSTARMSVLDGTQPTLTQVPPMVPWPISATLAPSSAAAMAAENPADPAPTTARSYRPLESSLVLQQSSMSGAFLRSRRLRTARRGALAPPEAVSRDAEEHDHGGK